MPAVLDWLWFALGGLLTLAIAVALIVWIADDLRRPGERPHDRSDDAHAAPFPAQADRSAETSSDSAPHKTR